MPSSESVIQSYRQTSRRLLLLDYDGVLTPIVSRPELARPTIELRGLIVKLTSDKRNKVVIVTGRAHEEIDDWLGDLPVDISAEHGSFRKLAGGDWEQLSTSTVKWKDVITPIIETATARLPGSFIEQKTTALVLHYRNVEQQTIDSVVPTVRDNLQVAAKNLPIIIQDGKKVIDVHLSVSNKGTAIKHWLKYTPPYDFIMIAGDDVTDEDMFKIAPKTAHTYHVGSGSVHTKRTVSSSLDIIALLSTMCGYPLGE